MKATILTGDCLELMRAQPDNSVDSVVTDPPYGIRFMGKAWDGADIEKRHASADSTNAARARNGKAAAAAAAAGMYDLAPEAMKAFQRFSEAWAAEAFRVLKPGGLLLSFASPRTYHRMASGIEDAGFEVRDQIMWIFGSGFPKSHNGEWGGTACKPAHEPIVMARKPLIGTVAKNYAEWGTGGLNIDGCRIGWPDDVAPEIGTAGWGGPRKTVSAVPGTGGTTVDRAPPSQLGRWPANVIHDGSAEALRDFPDAPSQQGDLRGHSVERISRGIYGDMAAPRDAIARGDSGSAARFFYCAKATAKDREAGLADFEKRAGGMVSNTSGQHITRRDEGYEPPQRANHHPTVKPTDLMRYLCRLVTPAGGVVLDPFMGSGSTGRGAVLEGFRFIGMEMDRAYVAIAAARIAAAESDFAHTATQADLFKESA